MIVSRCVTNFFGCFLEASFAEKENSFECPGFGSFLKVFKLGTSIPVTPVQGRWSTETLKLWCLFVAEQDEMGPVWVSCGTELWRGIYDLCHNCSCVNKPSISSQGFSHGFFACVFLKPGRNNSFFNFCSSTIPYTIYLNCTKDGTLKHPGSKRHLKSSLWFWALKPDMEYENSRSFWLNYSKNHLFMKCLMNWVEMLKLCVCRWWKPWTNPTSTCWQGERVSTRRQIHTWFVCRTMMATTRPRPSASTTSPGKVRGALPLLLCSAAWPLCCCPSFVGLWELLIAGFGWVSPCFC